MLLGGSNLPVEASQTLVTKDHLVLAIAVGQETNRARVDAGLAPLTLDVPLFITSYQKAMTMATTGQYGHVLKDGVTLGELLDARGHTYRHAGENLAFGYDAAPAVVAGWLASPVHARNLLNPTYTKLGLAVLPLTYDGRTELVFLQIFVGE